MKKSICIFLTALLLIMPLSNCLAADNSVLSADEEEFLEMVQYLFPDFWDDIYTALSDEKTEAKYVEFDCSTEKNGNTYILTVYSDDSMELLTEYQPVSDSVSRASYTKQFDYRYTQPGCGTSILTMYVYYNYTGANTAPVITGRSANGSYLTVKGGGWSSTMAYSRGNGFYYDEDAIYIIEPPKVYFIGLYMSATADEGHNFIVNKYAGPTY